MFLYLDTGLLNSSEPTNSKSLVVPVSKHWDSKSVNASVMVSAMARLCHAPICTFGMHASIPTNGIARTRRPRSLNGMRNQRILKFIFVGYNRNSKHHGRYQNSVDR